MNVSDKVLIEKTLAGSHRAFGQLIERYQGFVFTLCLKILDSREEAEETAQDAFLKVFDKLGSYKKESKFSTWLYTLVYRTALDRLKLKKNKTFSLDSENSSLQIPTARSGDAGYNIEQKDLKKLIDTVVNKLPAVDGSIISLYYLQGQSVKEIAVVTNLSVTNVKTKLFRAREKLKSYVSKGYAGEIEMLLNN